MCKFHVCFIQHVFFKETKESVGSVTFWFMNFSRVFQSLSLSINYTDGEVPFDIAPVSIQTKVERSIVYEAVLSTFSYRSCTRIALTKNFNRSFRTYRVFQARY